MPRERLLSRAEARALDERAVVRYGIPSFVLMENAGRGAAEEIARIAVPRAKHAAIVCGGGNNGGDGFVVARHLALAGWRVELWGTHDLAATGGDARIAREIAERMGLACAQLANEADVKVAELRWRRAGVLVDALLGTGASGAPRGLVAQVIEALNAVSGVPRFALDLPSGLDCDTGEAPGACVRADWTITFAAKKQGFARAGVERYTGRVVVAGIGAPLDE